jgi:RimJ/RimL family protein N-acetyltransferase
VNADEPGGHREPAPPPALEMAADAAAFAEVVDEFLARHMETNVLATILHGVRTGRFAGSSSHFGYALDGDGSVRCAVMRTPPWPLICTPVDPGDAPAIVAHWLEHDPEPPGVNADAHTARAIAAAWAALTGGRSRLRTRMAMHVLDAVTDPPRPAAGELRQSAPGDLDSLIDWWRDFEIESGVYATADSAASATRSRHGDGGLFVWSDGEPVSLVAINRTVGGIARVGPVYTPPAFRRRGYAGSAVAEVSRLALAGDAGRCMLYTDLSNPTSNKIYAEVGYRRISDWEEIEFERSGEA